MLSAGRALRSPTPSKQSSTLLVVEAETLETKGEVEDLSEVESDRLDKVNERLDALENRPVQFTDETKLIAGAVISLGYNGEIEVERGLVRKEDKPSV